MLFHGHWVLHAEYYEIAQLSMYRAFTPKLGNYTRSKVVLLITITALGSQSLQYLVTISAV